MTRRLNTVQQNCAYNQGSQPSHNALDAGAGAQVQGPFTLLADLTRNTWQLVHAKNKQAIKMLRLRTQSTVRQPSNGQWSPSHTSMLRSHSVLTSYNPVTAH